ncbi:hypothetical protein K0M31_014266 [Melipona bicolor]|uniref:Uncharacterized protein n=1 Tax=Melipona bicolor TaxID=60889 RepID=A0AA40KU90_9HYME|nr:hypothetical protein K0M31_014266 [Melipona bicolor]
MDAAAIQRQPVSAIRTVGARLLRRANYKTASITERDSAFHDFLGANRDVPVRMGSKRSAVTRGWTEGSRTVSSNIVQTTRLRNRGCRRDPRYREQILLESGTSVLRVKHGAVA